MNKMLIAASFAALLGSASFTATAAETDSDLATVVNNNSTEIYLQVYGIESQSKERIFCSDELRVDAKDEGSNIKTVTTSELFPKCQPNQENPVEYVLGAAGTSKIFKESNKLRIRMGDTCQVVSTTSWGVKTIKLECETA